ncbi:MAG: hypothetical protein RQ875_02225 [Vicingaceae bacterium]|nr:hypothetical protein [Vicingaceae bacterium]
MKLIIFSLCFVISSFYTFGQSLNGGYNQGLIEIIPDKFTQKTNDFKHIKPVLGFWRVKIIPESLDHGLNAAIEISIDQPDKVIGNNAEGGGKFYEIADFKSIIGISINFMIEGSYLYPGDEERKYFSTPMYYHYSGDSQEINQTKNNVPLFVEGRFVPDKSKSLTLQEKINLYQIEITSIKALDKALRGYSAIDNQVGKLLEDKKKKAKINNLLADAQNAESFGDFELAIIKYKAALELENNPDISDKISNLEKLINDADNKNKVNEPTSNNTNIPSNQKQPDSSQSSTNNNTGNISNNNQSATVEKNNTVTGTNKSSNPPQLDFWGNPINSETNTVNYGDMEVQNNKQYQQQMQLRQNSTYAKEQHEKWNASKQAEIDERNNAKYAESYKIASTDVVKDFETAKKQLNTGSGDALIKSSVTLANNAKNVADAQMGLIGLGVGVALKASENSAKKKQAQEAREERERLQKAEEKRIAEAKMAIKNTRLNFLKNYPTGELPLSSTKSVGNNLYYFVYSFKEADLENLSANIYVSNIFALGKYPDGTWPMRTKVEQQIKNLTSLDEVIVGPFYTLSEAQNVYSGFSENLKKINLNSNLVDYDGFNAHKETEGTLSQPSVKLDFWGTPIKN